MADPKALDSYQYRVVYSNGRSVGPFDTPIEAHQWADRATAHVERRTRWEPSPPLRVGCERHMDEPHNLCEACWAVEL